MGESYPTVVSLLGPGRLPLSKEKLFSSPETRLCVSELRVVKRKLFWSHLPKFTFQTWLGAGGLMLELTAQPLVTLWAGPATSRVSWSLGRLIRAEGPPGSKHFRGCRACRASRAAACGRPQAAEAVQQPYALTPGLKGAAVQGPWWAREPNGWQPI